MANVLPLELLHRIYKSDIGDVIDDRYMKVSGAFHIDEDKSVDENGFVHCRIKYVMCVDNLKVSQNYFAEWEVKQAPTPDSEGSVTYFHEPFVDSSIVNYEVESFFRTVDGMTNYHYSGELA